MRNSTAEAEVIVIAFETAYVPGANGKPILIHEGERRASNDPDVVASRGAWYVDGHRAEFVRARAEHAEELAIANTPPPPKPPAGWNEYVRCTEAYEVWAEHPLTRQPVRRQLEVGDVLPRSDPAYQMFPKRWERCDAPE